MAFTSVRLPSMTTIKFSVSRYTSGWDAPSRTYQASLTDTKEVLEPALDALAYLHSSGFVHGHLKPSNCMAIDGRLKISSDGVVPIGTSSQAPADDVWSLGMTLVEILTQRRPMWTASEMRDPALPDTLPAEFREIARNALRRDPRTRWTVGQIQKRLQGQPVAANTRVYSAVAGTALLLVLLAMVAGTLLLRHRESVQVPASQTQPAQTQPAQPAQTQASKPPAAPQLPAAAPQPPPAEPESKPPPVRPAHGEVVQEILPDVFPRARSSIHGRVPVSVRVEVDPSGNVADATLESAGPSQYFADLAVKAARRWKFAPADSPRAWILRFEFTRAGTKVATVKSNP